MKGVPGKGEKLMKMPDVAKMLGISPRTLYRMIADKLLPSPVAVTRRTRAMCESEIEAYIERIKRERNQ